MCWDGQLCELIRTCSSPAHPVLQPQRKPGHLPDQPTGHPLHTACTQVRLWRGCIHTLNTQSIAESVKCLIPSLSLSDLTITPLRASMTGLSWPPTPGMRTLVENGRWRSRTWLEPTTMVIAHPSNLQVFFVPLMLLTCWAMVHMQEMQVQIQHIWTSGVPWSHSRSLSLILSWRFSNIYFSTNKNYEKKTFFLL